MLFFQAVLVVCTVKYAFCILLNCAKYIEYTRTKNIPGILPYIVKKTQYIPRQAEYLHQQAVDYQNTYGIDQWWIGLTDFGKYFKILFSVW